MPIDPEKVFAGLVACMGLVAAIECGLAFIMRGERESVAE